MFRQTTFVIALSTLVIAGGLPTDSLPLAHTSTKKQTPSKPSSISVPQVVSTITVRNSDLEKSVFEQINRYRASLGLPKLLLDEKISRLARIHSQNMANRKVPFSHQGFERRVSSIPLRFTSASENVAFNQGYNDPAKQAVIEWIESPGHLVNIKGYYNLTGIGVAINSEGEVYLTQIFVRMK
jgi:uncharacterized protein YkwD